MQLVFEHAEKLMDGHFPTLYNLPEDIVLAYVGTDDKMYYRTAPSPSTGTGIDWTDDVRLYLLSDQPKPLSLDSNIAWLTVNYLPNVRTYFLWYSENRHRISMLPDDSPLYPPESPYRLYYGVDTDILYMNIAEYWQMIGTLHHGLLFGLEEDHHPQYLKRLHDAELPEASAALRGQLFVKRGGDGESDEIYICIKNTDDEYDWAGPLEFEE